MRITDRSKDVIKSGGEWISSIELENAAMGCAGVAEAAAVGLPHPKWDERPLLVVVKKAGMEVTEDEVLAHMTAKVAKCGFRTTSPLSMIFPTAQAKSQSSSCASALGITG